ncbi:MAG: zinc ribbon domain-containing protein [Spirochaetes bacterium]|nr:zinc ribbon domain-containing protein [Spirochaetota bacterium]
MKKPLQNVLAKKSNNSIAYLCGKCGKEVEKNATVCMHCGVKLGNIKCPFCYFTGSVEDFKYDTCPKCGRKNINNIILKGKSQLNYGVNSFSKRKFWFLFIILSFSLVIVFFTIIIVYFR